MFRRHSFASVVRKQYPQHRRPTSRIQGFRRPCRIVPLLEHTRRKAPAHVSSGTHICAQQVTCQSTSLTATSPPHDAGCVPLPYPLFAHLGQGTRRLHAERNLRIDHLPAYAPPTGCARRSARSFDFPKTSAASNRTGKQHTARAQIIRGWQRLHDRQRNVSLKSSELKPCTQQTTMTKSG